MRKVKYIISISVSIFAITAYCQDARIAHPFLWESYYNPARYGSEGLLKFDVGAQTNYTNRNSLFVDGHFTTEIGIGSQNVGWGIGLNVNNEYQGNGLLNVSSINPAFSVGLPIWDNYGVWSTLRVGVGGEFVSSHINKNLIVFADQLDPFYGKVIPESEELKYMSNETVWSIDMSAGIFGQTTIKNRGISMPIVINYGLGVSHLIGKNDISFYSDQKSSLYMPGLYYRRFSAQVQYAHPYETRKGKGMYFKGYGIYEYQGGMNDIQFGFVYNVTRFMIGISCKIEKYQAFTFTNILLHAVYSQPLGDYALMRIAYSFETPINQGSVTETTIHSLSLHFVVDYMGASHRHNKCKVRTRPSDAAWYEMNNTFPSHN